MQPRTSSSLALAATLASACLLACAPVPRNEPIAAIRADVGYRYSTLRAAPENSDGLLILLAFSGGGLRSAAFSYGVLERLARTQIAWEGETKTLLDEVDIISAASGGSLTAAAFGLYGTEIFEVYEDFLQTNMELGLAARLAAPWNWARLVSARFSRSDLLATYLDDLLFDGATYADLLERGRPLLRIHATEMAQWVPFVFDQETFDLLCSDVSAFPIARAAAASSAVPGVLTPVTLRSYVGSCGNEPLPAWAQEALVDPDVLARPVQLAEALAAYLDPDATQFVHLLDGSLTDNLGLRGVIGEAGADPWNLLAGVDLDAVQKLVVIVADAQLRSENAWGRLPTVPGGRRLADVGASVLLTRSTREVLRDAEDALENLASDAREHCLSRAVEPRAAERIADVTAICALDVYFIRLFAGDLPDEAAERRFNAIPTSLSLDDETLDWLRAAAGDLLEQSQEYRRLVRDLRGE